MTTYTVKCLKCGEGFKTLTLEAKHCLGCGEKIRDEKQAKIEQRRAKRKAKKEADLVKLRIKRAKKKWKQDKFYASSAWLRVRYKALKKYGRKCACCGISHEDGAQMHVDHIKPRRYYPELELDLGNLQVLCSDCNIGKGAWDHTNWRVANENNAHHLREVVGR